MQDLSEFLLGCGISCDMDQYHTEKNISDWVVWNVNNIRECAKRNGFVLLICSSVMYEQLNQPDISLIQMKAGFIDNLALNSLIRDASISHCVIPVCLEKLNMEIVPTSLQGKTIYALSFSKVNPDVDFNSTLNTPGLESLRSLVYKLRGEPEIYKPPLGEIITVFVRTYVCTYN